MEEEQDGRPKLRLLDYVENNFKFMGVKEMKEESSRQMLLF